MPRRIPDYPDVYAFWNAVSSYGSIVSVVGLLVFLVLLSKLFRGQPDLLNADRFDRLVQRFFSSSKN